MKRRFLGYATACVLAAGISLAGFTGQAKAETAKVTPNVTLSAGYAGEHMHYGETIGDQEHGWLNGFYVGVGYAGQNDVGFLGKPEISFKGTYLTNSITYDGSLQNTFTGQTMPYSTSTNESITELELHGGFNQKLSNKVTLGEYLILGNRYWKRDIKGTGGYTEDYENAYIGIGAKTNVALGKFNAGIDLSYRISPAWESLNYMETDNYPLAPNTNLKFNMGSAYNFKVEIPLSYNFTPHFSVNLTPYYSYWHFSGSGTQTINVPLAYTSVPPIMYSVPMQVLEPPSETNSMGLNVGVSYRF